MSVLGPSGCGKTTLLNIVAILSPTAGQVVLQDPRPDGGASVVTGPGADRGLIADAGASVVTGPGAERGMVFQQGALFEWLTVEKNVAFGPKMAGRPSGEIKSTVERLLAIVGLQDFAKKPVYQLSGGMQQRVALARCLANDPEVILMDERWARSMR